jgi:hypothetical protein
MTKPYIVSASWDDEAKVWVAESDDVPGLVTEAPTEEALLKKLETLVPELLELNGCFPTGERALEVVLRFHEHERKLSVAA